jgi:hypothetical protein
MAQIQPISTWYQGEERQATIFSLYGNGNNITSFGSASFQYQLIEEIVISPDEKNSQTLVTGQLSINGADYEAYNLAPDANVFIYQWAADKLNLVLIP